MGIQGLLPLLKSIMLPIHIKDLEGSRVAVDTYSWLHKGALSCSRDLCKGLPTSKHIDYCMHRVNLLRHYGVKPILVFDGGLLPMKSDQENKRARFRKENLARSIEHESNGNSAAAYECYQKAVDISPLIAVKLIQVLKQENISYVVAPYEADAQMTFLAINKQVDAVITEDSDLIPFGCPRIIFKMDKFGQGVEFRYDMLHHNKDLNFSGFTKQMLLEMCILSGCDYLPSLPGMGLKRAHALIKKFTCFDKVIKHLRYSTVSVPPLYEESFKKAILTFHHQRVYDPIGGDIVHLSDVSENLGDDLDFLGPLIPQDLAKGIAEGDLDPFTRMPFQVAEVDLEKTLQQKHFSSGRAKKKIDLPAQKNVISKYFCFASLEAKRKFRAPQISLNHLSLNDSSSPSPNEPAACKDNSSPECTHHSEWKGDIPPNYPVENDFDTKIPQIPEPSGHSKNVVLPVYLKDMVSEATSPEHILFQQSTYSVHKPCVTLQKQRECKNDVPDAVERKARIESRKVIVRSSYFKHKSETKSDLENKQEHVIVKHNTPIDMNEITCPKSDLLERNSLNAALAKRKISPNDISELENVKQKNMYTEMSPPNNGFSAPELDQTLLERKSEEEKFGSNISHLGHYSDVAEKSMERFVSVISSFRYSSSGSRASGLRAPLKDIRNTCTNRSNAIADFSKFAYVPKNGRTALPSRRRG